MIGVKTDHRPALAVGEAQLLVVAGGQDAVARGKRPAGDLQVLGSEASLDAQPSASAVVEIRDVGAPVSDHERVAARLGADGAPPIVDQPGARFLGIASADDPAVLRVRLPPAGDVTHAQAPERFDIPAFAL